MLQPEDLHNAVSDLATVYHQTFGLDLPPVNHEVLLYKYIMYLALPLEIFPTVQGLAKMTRSDFLYSTTMETRRKRGSAFPELQLTSLLVVAVRLLFPFDKVQRHPWYIHEPATQKIDWVAWARHRQELAKCPPGARLARGSEIDIRDTDVFKMSQQELDSYMNWYQRTWVREPRPGFGDGVNRELLDMFPLNSQESSLEQNSRHREQELERIIIQKAQSTTGLIEFQRPMTDEEALDHQVDVKRPGEEYESYKSEEELPELAKAFFEAAAETACTSVKNLLLAVLQTEAKIATWKRAKRRAEVTGQEFDLDAEMRSGGDGGRGGRVQQEVKAVDVGRDDVQSEESEEEDSDVDMRMVS
jgi:RNA polymerase I-specific transcription initiation factor RRN7